jgi:hypothetical protein
LFNSAKEKKEKLKVDLSLSEAQKKSLAWTKEEALVSMILQPRQQKLPQDSVDDSVDDSEEDISDLLQGQDDEMNSASDGLSFINLWLFYPFK